MHRRHQEQAQQSQGRDPVPDDVEVTIQVADDFERDVLVGLRNERLDTVLLYFVNELLLVAGEPADSLASGRVGISLCGPSAMPARQQQANERAGRPGATRGMRPRRSQHDAQRRPSGAPCSVRMPVRVVW